MFAPGYRFPDDSSSGLPVADPAVLVPLQGSSFAVATLSYRKSGLAVKQGVDDVGELFAFFANDPQACGYGRPARTWLVGGSEGALIATLVAEREAARPDPFVTGVLAACGPVGDFRYQIEHVVDFRVVFDALFPGVIPGSAVAVPPDVAASWDSVYEAAVRARITASPELIERALRASGAVYDPLVPGSIENTVLTLLEYNVRGYADVVQTLGGQPFGNAARVYSGSGDAALDTYINAQAERITADPLALAELDSYYKPTGRIARASEGGADIPLVTLHTTGDPLVPYRHEELYGASVTAAAADDTYLHVPIERYGHCAFEPVEVLGALYSIRLLR